MRRYWAVCSNYTRFFLLIGLLLAIPILFLPFYWDEVEYLPYFLIPTLTSFLIGAVVNLFTKKDEEDVTEWQSPLQRGSLPVLVAWCYAFVAGAMPFVLAGQLSFLLALFESVSGWTTTGLTVVDIANMPKIFLFHRSFMQYCGGLGFIMMIVMLTQGKQSMNLYNAEGHPDQLRPNLKKTARAIFGLYSGFLVFGTLLYRIFGMNLFESICHTMSALSTAGYSTRVGNIGEYGSYAIETVTIILMLVGATNFAVLGLLVKGKFRQLSRISELRFLFGLLLVFVPLSAASLVSGMGMGVARSLHEALFGLVSTFSTTGYSTMDYSGWPPLALGLVLVLMVVGGGIGSTAGGIKLIRAYLALRFTKHNIRKRLSPTRNITAPHYYRAQGKTLMDADVLEDAMGFIFSYLAILIAGTLLLSVTADCSLFDAMYEFASALGTVGISNGLTSPDASAGTLIIEIVGMILGRLEIFIIFIGAYSGIRMLRQGLKRCVKGIRGR